MAGPWRQVTVTELVDLVLTAAGDPPGRPRVVAVDGRSASGKSTLAERLHVAMPGSTVIHTDDLAWHEPLFGWGHLLTDLLGRIHRAEDVFYRPPQWDQRGRRGGITVPVGLDAVIVEGIGASQLQHADLVDATVWVQADFAQAEKRGIARDVALGVNGDAQQATAFWHDWMSHELTFFEEQEPWRRASVIANGSPGSVPADDQLEIAAPYAG
jgi:putative protein kinase ArgK-like GTPase of G3E family